MTEPCCPSTTCCPESGSLPEVRIPDQGPETASVPVSTVPTELSLGDRLGLIRMRLGMGRMTYTVEPGLYAVGDPDRTSEVLVTANYRLTFDHLRSTLTGQNLWILVLDTRGINVWCAAGKGTFGTDELVNRISSVGLDSVVSHRRVIVPQLGAPGIAAHEVRERSGFRVIYGPVEARDIPAYLTNRLRATAAMRIKRFPLRDRAVLIPVEIFPAIKYAAMIGFGLALLGGLLGSGTFLADAAVMGMNAGAALLTALIAGCILVPILLPFLPGRAFAVKGMWAGLAAAAALMFYAGTAGRIPRLEASAWLLAIPALSSFLAMNFTGSSTYTSLSGVRREMRFAVPLQIGAVVVGLLLWVASAIVSGGGAA